MKIGLLGGLRVEHDGAPIAISGTMQLAVFFRLAVDAGRPVAYREIVEDVWGADAPENERAALQSVISRLRSQLPAGAIESTLGGYRLAVAREDVDALLFGDLVAAKDPDALALWTGDPWIPSDNFDWFERDLLRDHAAACALGEPVRSSIPVPLTGLVGRESELAMVDAQLRANRLVSIVGTGGAGKTRLAIETAREHEGALLVELAPVGKGEVMAAVLSATGRDIRTIEASETVGTRGRVLDALRGRDIVLVLDNCEHVVDEVAGVVDDLLSSLPHLRILATSREPLAVPGEALVAVGSLPRDAAVELFRQRGLAASGVEPDPVIGAGICERLDRLPLAIELAAARLRTMTEQEVLDGLEHRFTLLTGGYRTALPRHQTLRAMIDWSWSLLTEPERTVLAHLAVFPSGVDADDADALTERMGAGPASVLDLLVDKSLLQRSRGRYRTLETIREYGLERLAESGETESARRLQVAHETERVVAMDRLLRGPGVIEAIAWFDAEEDNISAALRFAIGAPMAEQAVVLAVACTWYWIVRDRQDDAWQWLPLVLPLAEGLEGDEAEFMRLVQPIVAAFLELGEPDRMPDGMAEILAPLAELQPRSGTHDVLQLLSVMLAALGAVADDPGWMLTVTVPSGEELGLDPWPTALLHVMAAAVAQNRGEFDAQGRESLRSLEMFGEIGDLWGLAIAKEMRAHWLVVEGNLSEALELTDSSTETMGLITSSSDLAQQQGLGIQILVRLGRIEEARDRVDKLLASPSTASNGRTRFQANIAAVGLDVIDGDVEAARARLVDIEELAKDWPRLPAQFGGWIGILKARVALLTGDADAAELHARAAADAALESHDQPVIGEVAVVIGSVALARGDFAKALEAVDLSTQLFGHYDATHPQIVEIEKAAAERGIGRPAAETADRPIPFDAVRELAGA